MGSIWFTVVFLARPVENSLENRTQAMFAKVQRFNVNDGGTPHDHQSNLEGYARMFMGEWIDLWKVIGFEDARLLEDEGSRANDMPKEAKPYAGAPERHQSRLYARAMITPIPSSHRDLSGPHTKSIS